MAIMRARAMAAALLSAALFAAGPVDKPASPTGFVNVRPRGHVLLCQLKADPHNAFTRIGSPAERGPSLRMEGLAAITVNYTGFTAEQQAAFQYAVNIWASQLTSSVPIVVNASFASLSGTTLAQAGANWVYRDFTAARFANTWYVNALANTLAGYDLSTTAGDSHEIYAEFNINYASSFYYGTDGLTPAGKYDFASVVLHELGHGLGFLGWATVSGGIGRVGDSTYGYPMSYDRFVENLAGQDILTFPNSSAELGAQLTGNNLYWNGSIGVSGNGGNRPKLYIPGTWESGSSYSHLDDNTYQPGNANSLMTHAIAFAEAIHDPGPITRGMFADQGWTVAAACPFNLTATGTVVPQAGGTGSVGVFAVSGCTWTANSNASWITITSGPGPTTNNGNVTFTVAANIGAPRTGTMTIAGLTYTVAQGPSLSADVVSLRFGAVNFGGTLTSVTSAQTVVITQTGSPAASWTVTASQPWMQLSATSGTGNGSFTVSLVNTGSLPASGTVTGTVNVSSAGSATQPSVPVSLTIYAPATTARPFGALDAPAGGPAAVSGSIVVGGWALDDVEIRSVEVFRDRLATEADPPTPLPAGHPATGKIYLATAEVVRTKPFGPDTALFVQGARNDIAALFPNNPHKERAGWGYLMLTWGLPNQGTGTYTLYAYAFDRDGTYPTQYTLLGAKTFTSDNRATTATARKPFGALDAPYPGEVVSGTKLTGGWALTQPSTCLVTTVQVGIDSAPLQPVIFGDPKAGFQTIFPTASFANSPNCGTAYFLDTTTLTNGVHQIGYLLTDSCGHQEGVGSRFFSVLNSGGSLIPEGATADGASAESAVAHLPAPPLTGRAAEDVTVPTTAAPIAVARGYGDEGAEPMPAEIAAPNDWGIRVVTARPLERIVLHLPQPPRRAGDDSTAPLTQYTGYEMANGQLRALPLGSTLDGQAGIFYWQPGPAYLGAYDLVFIREDISGVKVQVPVRVEVQDEVEAPQPPPAIEDEPSPAPAPPIEAPVPTPAESSATTDAPSRAPVAETVPSREHTRPAEPQGGDAPRAPEPRVEIVPVEVASPTTPPEPEAAPSPTPAPAVIVSFLDRSAPVIEATVTPKPGRRGLVRGPATIEWRVSDPESGVIEMTGCEERRLTRSATVTCTATNGAGQTATRTVRVRMRNGSAR